MLTSRCPLHPQTVAWRHIAGATLAWLLCQSWLACWKVAHAQGSCTNQWLLRVPREGCISAGACHVSGQ